MMTCWSQAGVHAAARCKCARSGRKNTATMQMCLGYGASHIPCVEPPWQDRHCQQLTQASLLQAWTRLDRCSGLLPHCLPQAPEPKAMRMFVTHTLQCVQKQPTPT
jgi:hypothetical protein